MITLTESAYGQFNVSPNPVHGNMIIRCPADIPEATIRVISMQGKILYVASRPFNSGETFSISTAALPAGLYVVDIVYGAKRQQLKVIKQ